MRVFILSGLFFLAAITAAFAQKRTCTIRLTNPLPTPREHELVVLAKEKLPAWMWKLQLFKAKLSGGVSIPIQMDDLDGDGEWDELALAVHKIAAKGQSFVTISELTSPINAGSLIVEMPSVTHARLGVSAARDGGFAPVDAERRPAWWTPQLLPQRYQCEGPGIENDKVAFRTYFDYRHGIDIFGKGDSAWCYFEKRAERFGHPLSFGNAYSGHILDSIGVGPSYHDQQPWGMDVLKVGNSLGAGGLALRLGDTLYRVGNNGPEEFRLINRGPVRAIIRLTFPKWGAGKDTTRVSQDLWVSEGKFYYQSRVRFGALPVGTQLAVGMVTLKLPPQDSVHTGKAASHSVLYSYGNQSENHDGLGMALYIPVKARRFDLGAKSAGVGSTSGFSLPLFSGISPTYTFMAGWSKSPIGPGGHNTLGYFSSAKLWAKYVSEQSDLLDHPLQIVILK